MSKEQQESRTRRQALALGAGLAGAAGLAALASEHSDAAQAEPERQPTTAARERWRKRSCCMAWTIRPPSAIRVAATHRNRATRSPPCRTMTAGRW